MGSPNTIIEGHGVLLKFHEIEWNALWQLTQAFNNTDYVQDITLSPANSLEFLRGYLDGSNQPSRLKDFHQYNRALAMRSAYSHMWYTLSHIIGFEFHVITSIDDDYESSTYAILVTEEEFSCRKMNWDILMALIGCPGIQPEPIWAMDEFGSDYELY